MRCCWGRASRIKHTWPPSDCFLFPRTPYSSSLAVPIALSAPGVWKWSHEAAHRGLVVVLCTILATCLPVPVLWLFCVASQSEVALESKRVLGWVLKYREEFTGQRRGGSQSQVRKPHRQKPYQGLEHLVEQNIKGVNNGHSLEIHLEGRG